MRKVGLILIAGALAVAAGCGGGTSTSTPGSNTVVTAGSNVAAVTVDGGPAGLNPPALNSPFVTVTVCAHGSTTNCQTIDHVLVDTGSIGLRLLSTSGGGKFNLSLPPVVDINGSQISECGLFVSNVTYGSVRYADIQIASESTATSSGVPIQIIGDMSPLPSSCSQAATPMDTLNTLGANGILGVGFFPIDCGNICQTAATTATLADYSELYYSCPASGCVAVGIANAQQVANPVVFFPTDNNGTILELQAVSSPQNSIPGSLVFGIGTQGNNSLSGATVFPIDPGYGTLNTIYNNVSYTGFIDSGSNGLYILNDTTPGFTMCTDPNYNSFFCSNLSNLAVQNQGYTGTPTGNVGSVNITSAATLFTNNPNANVYENLAGPSCTGCTVSYETWDWGLPFFFGRNVYTSIESATAAPFVAYK